MEKGTQVVGVYHEGSDSDGLVYYFEVIPESKYDELLLECLNSGLEAVFVISSDEFEGAKGQNWKSQCENLLYIDQIKIAPSIRGEVIYDVLSDFMVINAAERGASIARIKIENLSKLKKRIKKNGYSFIGKSHSFSYFEIDVDKFGE